MKLLITVFFLLFVLFNSLFTQTIDFDQFTTSSYYVSPLEVTEEGETFIFTITGGDPNYGFKSMASYPGELLLGDDGGGTTRITITHKDGYTFDFSSLDVFVSIINANNWIIRGYLSNTEVSGSPITFTLVQNDPYRTKNINLTQVDKITLEENPVNPAGFEIWIDKFVVTNVLPVELIYFNGYNTQQGIILNWETATEVNNYGFEVQKSVVSSQNSEENFETIGFVQGNGTTNSPKDYVYTDSELPNSETVKYRLKQIDNDGTFAYSKTITVDLTNITSVEDDIVYKFALEQNYPNPFNPSTTIEYTIPSVIGSGAKQSLNTILKVYDLLGREVATLVNQKLQPGIYEVQFDASSLSSGIYIYRISIDDKFTSEKKMFVLK